MADHPIRLVVDDDLRRSRLTVLFRLLLSIPHFIWLFVWGIAVFFAAIAGWFATLFVGQLPAGLHRFLAAYVRYWTHVFAYLYLAANPFPGFTGEAGAIQSTRRSKRPRVRTAGRLGSGSSSSCPRVSSPAF